MPATNGQIALGARDYRAALASAALALALLISAPALSQQTAAGPPSGTQSPSSNAAEAHVARGYDALKDDRYTVAADEFRAALALNPSLVLRARFPLAVALFEMHNNADSRRELEQVRQVTGDHPNVMYYLGRVDLEEHNFEQAIGHFSKAAAKPPFPDTAYYLGFAYFKHGDLALAEEWLKKAALATPHDSRVPYQLGFVLRQEGRPEESRKAFAQAAQLRQRDADEARIQSECAQKLQQGARDQARAVCDQLYDDNDAERLTELGTLYGQDRKSTRLNSSHPSISYAVFCLKKKKKIKKNTTNNIKTSQAKEPRSDQISFAVMSHARYIGHFSWPTGRRAGESTDGIRQTDKT